MALEIVLKNVDSLFLKFERQKKDLKINMEEHLVCRKLSMGKKLSKAAWWCNDFFFFLLLPFRLEEPICIIFLKMLSCVKFRSCKSRLKQDNIKDGNTLFTGILGTEFLVGPVAIGWG